MCVVLHRRVYKDTASATTLVSVWNTRVFRTALMALAEPWTLWRGIRRHPSRRIHTLQRLLYHASYSCDTSRCILHSPLPRQASFTLRLACGDVYVPSERHVCYTLRRACSYAVTIYTTPGDVYAILRPITTCRTLIYVQLWDFVTYCNTVFASDTLLAVSFALPLLYFTCLKYTVQSSHSLVLCPQSSTFCVDPSSACDASSSSSASASSPSSPSYPSTSQVPRSNLSSSVAARRHRLAVGMASLPHLHLRNPCCHLASRNAVRHPCNCCLSRCSGQCFRSHLPQAPLQRSNSQEE